MTQKERLLEWLQENGPINPLLAWRRLGIYRLSDTIFRLRKDGWDIATKTIDVKNQFDEKCHVAEYGLNDILSEKKANIIIIDDPISESTFINEKPKDQLTLF